MEAFDAAQARLYYEQAVLAQDAQFATPWETLFDRIHTRATSKKRFLRIPVDTIEAVTGVPTAEVDDFIEYFIAKLRDLNYRANEPVDFGDGKGPQVEIGW